MQIKINKTKSEELPRESALRLLKLAQSGIELDEDLMEIVNKCKFDRNDSDHRDEYAEWVESVWVDDLELTPENLKNASVEVLMAAIKDWKFENDGFAFKDEMFRALFLDHPIKTLNATCRLADAGCWQPYAWQVCLRTLNLEMDGIDQMIGQINRHLISASDNQFNLIHTEVLLYLKLVATVYDTSKENIIATLWLRVWRTINRNESYLSNDNNAINRALNSPAGKMADVALTRLWKHSESEVSGELPVAVKEYFEEISDANDGHFGRLVLMMRLFSLFEVDPTWTRDNLISRLSPAQRFKSRTVRRRVYMKSPQPAPEKNNESQELWLAYSSSERIGPNLLAAFKPQFIEILSHPHKLSNDRLKRQLTNIFMSVCLILPPSSLKSEEKKQIMQSMSEDMLISALTYIKIRIVGDDVERAEIWRMTIMPWLNEYWPPLGQFKSQKLSEIMLEIIANCGDAYCEAARWFLKYLKPVEGKALSTLEDISLTNESATATLEVLDKIIAGNTIHPSNKSNLKHILDNIKTHNPTSDEKKILNALYKIAQT